MKADNHPSEKWQKEESPYRPWQEARAETAVWASLSVAGVVAVIFALASVSADSKQGPLEGLEKLPMVHYVRSGQWIADARTAAAMVRFVLEPEKPRMTNVDEKLPTNGTLAMPTNHSAGCKPKA